MSDMFSFFDDGSDSGGDLADIPTNINFSDLNLSELGSGFAGDIGNVGLTPDSLQTLLSNPELMAEFAKIYPDEANILQGFPTAAEMKQLEDQAKSDTDPGGAMTGSPFGTQSGGTRGQTILEKLGIGAGSDGKGILGTGISGSDAAKYAAIIAAMKMAYDDAEKARKEAKGTPFKSSSGYKTVTGKGGVTGFKKAAEGGIMSLEQTKQPFYLGGMTDGMADKVPAHIDNKRPAALSDGEFVIPADVVSHLGNGNSNAGAKRLYEMMDDIREARTGNTEQGKQIDPEKFTKGVASFSSGGVARFQEGGFTYDPETKQYVLTSYRYNPNTGGYDELKNSVGAQFAPTSEEAYAKLYRDSIKDRGYSDVYMSELAKNVLKEDPSILASAKATKTTTTPTTYKRADGTPVTLPSDWDSYSPAQKTSWMNANKLTEADFKANGIPQTDIDYWKSVGFIPYVAPKTPTTTTDIRSDFEPSVSSYGGVKVEGESGLREGYAPYVQDYLERISGLLARRDVDPITGKPTFTGPQFGDTGVGGYGADTFKTLQSLQTQRENMMGTGAGATPTYQPYQYSFASPVKAAKGGVMSLGVEKFAGGGYAAQTVPSTFNAPDAFSPTTYSSGYQTPSTYQAGTIGSTYQGTTPYTGSNVQSTYQAPGNIYQAGTIGSTYQGTAPYTGSNIQSAYQAPGDIYKAAQITSGYQAPAAYQASTFAPERATAEEFGQAQAEQYMSPYISGVVDPQLREARRQADITRQAQAARMAKAGAFGGSRQAIMESELNRNLATQLSDIYGTGQQKAFESAQAQFERDQARQAAAQQLNIQKGLEAQQLGEQSRQFGAGLGARSAELAAQLGLQAQTATEAAKQAAGAQALTSAQTAAQLGLEAARAREQASQFGAGLSSQEAQTKAQLALQGQTAQEQAKQAAGAQALTSAQTAAQLGLEAARAREQASQFGAGLTSQEAQTRAQLGLQGQTAQEAARQAAGQQAINAAQIAAQLGLQGSELSERSRQFAANYGLQSAQTAAQYEQAARQLQQQAEEAQARGDQFGATLALQQLQEAQRAAEATRGFEYQQARDTYLDPFRELMYASQALSGLPIAARAAGDSASLQALLAGLGLSGIVNPSTKTTTSDRRLKTDIQPIGMLDDGLKVYSYRYKSGGPVQIGVMADEVAILRPQAYIKGGAGDGFDAVDYSKL